MKTYTVTIKISLLEFYEVEAETPEEAMEDWGDGIFLYSDDTYLDAVPLKVKEVKANSSARTS